MYGTKYAPSAESLGPPRMGMSEGSTPTFLDAGGATGTREPYPAWSPERQIPLSKEEIEDIFLDLTQKFGFQRDSMRNMVRGSGFVEWSYGTDWARDSLISRCSYWIVVRRGCRRIRRC